MEVAQRGMVEDKREQQAAAGEQDNLRAQNHSNVVLKIVTKYEP